MGVKALNLRSAQISVCWVRCFCIMRSFSVKSGPAKLFQIVTHTGHHLVIPPHLWIQHWQRCWGWKTEQSLFVLIPYARLGVLSRVNQVHNWCFDLFLISEKGCYLRGDFPLSTSATPCVNWWWWYRLLIKISSPRATADCSCCSGQALQCSLLWEHQDKQALVAEPFLKTHLMLSTCFLGTVTKRSLSSLSSSFCDLCPLGFRPGYSMDFLGWWLPSTSKRSVIHDDFITAFSRVKNPWMEKKNHWQAKNFKVSSCWDSNIRK